MVDKFIYLFTVFSGIFLVCWLVWAWGGGFFRMYRMFPLLLSLVAVSIFGSLPASIVGLLLLQHVPRGVVSFVTIMVGMSTSILIGGKFVFSRLPKKTHSLPEKDVSQLQLKDVNWGDSIASIIGAMIWLQFAGPIGRRYFPHQYLPKVAIIIIGLFVFSQISRAIWRRLGGYFRKE